MAVGLIIVAAALTCVAVAGIVLTGSRWFEVVGQPPSTPVTDDNARVGAAWAGFPSTTGLSVRDLYHQTDRVPMWRITWNGSPGAAEAFLRAGGFSDSEGQCTQPWIHGVGAVRLRDCRYSSEERRAAHGTTMVRNVTRGVLPDGTYVLYLEAFEPD